MSINENPLVSILVANHNNARFIEDALDSVLAQTYSNIEIVVVDDASTDNSLDVINNYIKVHSNRNIMLYQTFFSHGCGRVKRKCVDIARGKYFAFLDPDDAIAPDSIEKMVSIHEKCPKYSIVYCNQFLCDDSLKIQSISTWSGEIPPRQSNLTSKQGHVSALALCKKYCYDQTEGINPEYIVAEDQDLYFKMEEVAPVFFLNEPLYYYRKHDHNMSFSEDKEARNRYWLYQCKKAAYYRRKRTHLNIPNVNKKEILVCSLNYHIAEAKAKKEKQESWMNELLKVCLLTPVSIRKGIRGIKTICSSNK